MGRRRSPLRHSKPGRNAVMGGACKGEWGKVKRNREGTWLAQKRPSLRKDASCLFLLGVTSSRREGPCCSETPPTPSAFRGCGAHAPSPAATAGVGARRANESALPSSWRPPSQGCLFTCSPASLLQLRQRHAAPSHRHAPLPPALCFGGRLAAAFALAGPR